MKYQISYFDMNSKKKCEYCNKPKFKEDYYPNKLYMCKVCISNLNKKKYQLIKDNKKNLYNEKRDKLRLYYLDNKEDIIKKSKVWKIKNRIKVLDYKRKANLKRSAVGIKKKSLW